MPRIMTMNGDHQSVATAPLDLRITNRERGSAGSRTPDCRGCAGDARVTGGSPAPPACTVTDGLEIPCHAARTSEASEATRKRPGDKSSLKLPFRKRQFHVEPETQRQSPAATCSAERFSPEDGTDFRETNRESHLPGSTGDIRVGAAPVIHNVQETGALLNPVCLLPPFNYAHYQVYCLQPAPESNHLLVHQPENLLSGIALATRQDEDGDTALHIAVVQGELAFVYRLIHLLLLDRRSPDIYNNLRQTPLHLAVITQQPDMVHALLRGGADPAALDRNGQTALHLCCEYNQQECLSVVLSQSSSPTCLEIRNYEGFSPLHLAVLRGHKNLARILLEAGADINAMDIKSGQSPLMHAVENNNADMVHFLIEKACDVNSQSYSGNTALHSACGRGQVDTVRLLLKSGADSSLKNYHNDTPVMVAKNKKITDVLRGRGSKPLRGQDQNCVSVSPHGSNQMETGSPSPNHSQGCSPSTTPLPAHHISSHSPQPPSMHVFTFY